MHVRASALAALVLAATNQARSGEGPCGHPTPVAEARNQATVVFRGKVDRVTTDTAGCKAFFDTQRGKVFDDDLGLDRACGARVTLTVSALWKGEATRVTYVRQGAKHACEPRLEAGHTYLVFARRLAGAPELWMFDRSGTRPLDGPEAADALAALGPPR